MSKLFKKVIGRVEVVVGPDLSSEKRYWCKSPHTGVVEPCSPEAMATEIERLLATDKDLEAMSVSELPDGRLVMSMTSRDEPEVEVKTRRFWVGYVLGAQNMLIAGMQWHKTYLLWESGKPWASHAFACFWVLACAATCFVLQWKADERRLRIELRRVSSKP